MTIADNLKAIRGKHGYTQGEIAEAAGVNVKSYQAYEEGRAVPPLFTAQRIAKFYGITIDQLIGPEQEERVGISAAYYSLPLDKRRIVDFILGR